MLNFMSYGLYLSTGNVLVKDKATQVNDIIINNNLFDNNVNDR